MKHQIAISILLVTAGAVFLISACEEPERIAVIQTGGIEELSDTSVLLNGYIIDLGEGVYTYGHRIYSNEVYPNVNKTQTYSHPQFTGRFTSRFGGLTPFTTYYFQAFATSLDGQQIWGEQMSFTTIRINGTFTDERDGKIYRWVRIGIQVWMAENLAYLTSVNPPTSLSSSSPYFYVYGYEGTSVFEAKVTTNYSTYGVLYNWPAAVQSCPTGWHLPSDMEWTELSDYLGSEEYAGDALKETGYDHWNWYINTASNRTGFTALPGGAQTNDGIFINIGTVGKWWSSSEYSLTDCWSREINLYPNLYRFIDNKQNGYSVRCVKD